MLNGRYSTAKTSVSHRIGQEFTQSDTEPTLSDILEQTVDPKYFLSQTAIDRLVSYKDTKVEDLIQPTERERETDAIRQYDRWQEHSPREQRGISDNGWQADKSERLSPQVKQIAMMQSHRNNPNQYRVYDIRGIAPCLNKAEGGGRTPYILLDDKRNQN